jgi:hypothetical protein
LPGLIFSPLLLILLLILLLLLLLLLMLLWWPLRWRPIYFKSDYKI